MCGRFTLSAPSAVIEVLAPVLDDPTPPAALEARFNVAPTQFVPIVANRSRRALELARWGLIPVWAKDPAIGHRMINARGESVGEKPAFREALARRRCLVPADGFYEWKRAGKARQPYFIHQVDRRPFAFAGLWERWRPAPDADWLVSFSIVTCPANPLVAPLHDRMPVVLAPADWARWLAREPVTADQIRDLLVPADPAGWVIEPVGSWVNRPDHEGPECIAPGPVQGSLF